ncbi:MAG: hypothetical protein R3F49_22175 [Planctomycetota bacterium]
MNTRLAALALGLGLVSFVPSAAAQGSDSCASAQPIAGFGLFPFNNAAATPDNSSCSMGHDVWFAWTASATGNVTVSTCGQASFDSFLAAFGSTSCPPTNSLGCNDDSCGLQSTITFAAVAGTTYLIEVGTYQNSAGGAGSIEVTAGGSTGGCQNPSVGPDVIVGDVSDVSNYGPVNGMVAYALGTTSCNIGDQELDWIANSPNHPVIGQNIYRLNDGRFEQIGQSWLKHGFTALQLNLCCACQTSSSGGSRLGVGCSDPYGSGLNGSQSGLGPRSEVNATTGAFLYPYGSQGQSGNAVYKRAQVLESDVLAANFPNATYYGEAQYVTPDDAAAGNGRNNVSWRPLTRSGTNLQVSSSTRRAEPALMAWQAADPTVDLQVVDIPGEGRLWVGSNCYDLGNGSFRYEYVVFNLNSHRSVGSFTVPVGVGAQVSNMGMSFPRSHSGEPYDNTAWPAQFLGDRVVWDTATFATNPNANAIRWGTTYSFWFEANIGPEVKTASLGLFRPGVQADPTADVCGPMGGSGNPSVSSYCTAAVNSTGLAGVIDATQIDLNARSMQLTAANLPLNASAFSLASLQQGFVANPGGSSGNICVGGSIGRVIGGTVLNTGGVGSLLEVIDLDLIAQPNGAVAVQSGDTWHFQFWHRDTIAGIGVPTSNFTNGVRVLFP